MSKFTRTGVFANEKQIERMKAAQGQPYFVVKGLPPRSPLEIAHDCAIEAGLPEIAGHYGCNLATGEFIEARP